MGSYHSYVGDAKLEDSKDNWYRISGLNVSRWNNECLKGDWPGPRKKPADLENNDIGYLSIDKTVWSHGYCKILNFTPDTVMPYSIFSAVNSTGRAFTIKDRAPYEAKDVKSSDDSSEIGKTVNVIGSSTYRNFSVNNMHMTYRNTMRSGMSGMDSNNVYFRPMLTLKPKGGEVLEHFTLKIKITRKFTRLTDPRPYRISFAQEVIEGNPSIIKETICRFGIGRNGADLPDDQLVMSRVTADSYAVALEPGELIAHRGPHGAANPASNIGILYKLINGKYLYISQVHSLPGMEQPWPDNGGITTSIVTFTEADAYTI